MRDINVRQALRFQLLKHHSHELDSTRYVDELDICGVVRADVAVMNGSFTGYELKSASDSLARLPTQVQMYSKVFDYAVLVVADNHLDQALPLLPSWWGVDVVNDSAGEITLKTIVPPSSNPHVDPESLVTFLWREETLEALTRLGLAKGVRTKPKRVLWNRLINAVPLDQLREMVREYLKAREGWRPDRLRLLNDGKCSTSSTS